ncbi:MAG: hypothetical protein Tsb0010_03630 [Parvularculaceae bacterium]
MSGLQDGLRSVVYAVVGSTFLLGESFGQPETPAPRPEVFAPGVVSGEEWTLYKGAFAPDAMSFYFFRQVSGEGEDYRIYATERRDGEWGAARRVRLGEDYSDMYPAISPDGAHLVFSSYRPLPGSDERAQNANLWISSREGEVWGDPRRLASLGAPENYDAGPFFGPDGALYFASTLPDWTTTHFYRAELADGRPKGTPEAIDMTGLAEWRADALHFWNAIPSPRRDIWIAEYSPRNEDGRPGPADLYAVERLGEVWGTPQRLAGGVNAPDANDNFATFSPDGADLYFVREFTDYLRLPLDAALQRE